MKTAAIVVAASMAVAGIQALPASAANTANSNSPTTAPSQQVSQQQKIQSAPQNTPMQSAGKLNNSANSGSAIVAADAQIHDVVASLIQYALTPNDLPRLVTLFAQPQQQQINKSLAYSQVYGDRLNTQIEAISKAWTKKYGHAITYTRVQDALSSSFTSIQAKAANKTQPTIQSKPGAMADFSINRANAKTNLQATLVCDNNDQWKIDVPSSLTAQRLRDNLLAQLTWVNDQSAHWPKTESAAYRLVSRHVLMAVLDKPMPAAAKTASAQPKAAQSAVAQSTANQIKPVPTASAQPVAHHWWQFWQW